MSRSKNCYSVLTFIGPCKSFLIRVTCWHLLRYDSTEQCGLLFQDTCLENVISISRFCMFPFGINHCKNHCKSFCSFHTKLPWFFLLNMFRPMFLFPKQAFKKTKVFWCFQRVSKGKTGLEWIKVIFQNSYQYFAKVRETHFESGGILETFWLIYDHRINTCWDFWVAWFIVYGFVDNLRCFRSYMQKQSPEVFCLWRCLACNFK